MLFFFFIFNTMLSQNYYYSKRVEAIKYIDSNGKNASKILKANTGNFRMFFELNLQNNKPLFTEYINDRDMGWYGLLQEVENKEYNGTIYEQGFFFSTDYSERVFVTYSLNKEHLTIFKGNKIIDYKR